MSISIKEVEHVAILARLSLSDNEKLIYSQQLTRIIEHFAALGSIDTDGVEPMAHALPLLNVTRTDEVKRSISRDKLLANAPDREGLFFRVPKIGE